MIVHSLIFRAVFGTDATSGALRHLKKHPEKVKQDGSSSSTPKGQLSIVNFMTVRPTYNCLVRTCFQLIVQIAMCQANAFNKEQFFKKLVKFIVLENQPFVLSEADSFRDLFPSISTLPTGDTIRNRVSALFNEEKDKMRKMFNVSNNLIMWCIIKFVISLIIGIIIKSVIYCRLLDVA